VAETPLLKSGLSLSATSAAARIAAIPGLWLAALAAIVILGATLRLNGLDWDTPEGDVLPQQMHPDERFLSIVTEKLAWPDGPGQWFDTASSPLNPYNHPDTPSFVYGTFPIFLVKGVANVARDDIPVISATTDRLLCGGVMARQVTGTDLKYRDLDDAEYPTTVVCGRHVTAVFDTATIVLLFLLGVVLLGRVPGLLAALLYALSVLPAQLSHFWAVDPYVVFFATATMLLSALHITGGMRREIGGAMLEAAGSPPPSARRAASGPWMEWTRTAAIVVGLGLCVGLGLASKVTAWPIALGPVLAAAVRIGLRDATKLGLRWDGDRPKLPGHWSTDISLLCISALISILVFRIAQPYAFQGPTIWDMALNSQWVDDINRERDFQKGNVDFPPFVQFAGRTAWLWPLRNMVLFGFGPALGVAAWAAATAAVVVTFKRREVALILPVAMVVAVMAFQGPRFVAYMRYFAPMYPFLCLLAAWGARELLRQARRPRNLALAKPGRVRSTLRTVAPGSTAFRRLSIAGIAVVVALTAWWAVAFQSVYSQEHPRLAATRWLFANTPDGATITGEYWDDTIPYGIPGLDQAKHPLVMLYMYDTDSLDKVQALVYGRFDRDPTAGLNGADYVAITSNRIRDSIPRLPLEYPATIRYYDLLESGELGFDLVARFKTSPTFLGISVDDASADESFTVYDHPEVRIYKKTERWDPNRAYALLVDAHPERAVNILPRQGRTNGLQFTPEEAAVQARGGTFSRLFDADGLTSRVPWVWWLLWLEIAAFATVPWLAWLFRGLPDRGFGLSKLAGFLCVGLASWLLIAWGASHFTGQLVWGVFIGLAVTGYVTGYLRRRTLVAEARDHWRSWLAAEAVFLAGFFAVLALRYNNPDLWHHPLGGEKPVEFAFLNAVARSTILPPVDPWFAGGTMNYYYMGWFLVAVPMRALRIVPEIGFNLGLATYAGLAASVAFSTVHNLVGLTARARPGARSAHWNRRAILAGIGGALLFMGIGNLDAGHQTIERLQALNLARVEGGVPVYHWALFSDVPFLGGLVGTLSGLWRWLFTSDPMPAFDWWRSSRAHPGTIDITEFPLFSFLFGDLHAHLMAFPFFGLVIALSLAYAATANQGLRRQTWGLAAAMGLALGLMRTVNTWDFPTAVLLGSAAIVTGQVLRSGRWQERWWDAVFHLALAAGLLLVLFAPYTAHFEVFEAGLKRAEETTRPQQYFAHFGVFVLIMAAFLAVRYFEEARQLGRDGRANPVFTMLAGPWEAMATGVFLVGLLALTRQLGQVEFAFGTLVLIFVINSLWLLYAVRPDRLMTAAAFAASVGASALIMAYAVRHDLTSVFIGVGALALLFNLIWLEYRAPSRGLERDPGRIVATAAFAAAVGIAGGIDIVQSKFDIVRMNTVFKFSLQAWQLYAVASGYALWYVLSALWNAEGWRIRPQPGRAFAAAIATAGIGVLVFGASIYTWSGVRARQEARFEGAPSGTLDGLAYLPYGVFTEDMGTNDPNDDRPFRLADDEPLIDWLRENVRGTPVIVEAVGPLYHWTGRISWNTGLPTVIGWDWHEIQQRQGYDALVQRRRAETQQFYTSPDTAFALEYLRRYNVSYVVVGTEEHAFGTAPGLAKFEQMGELTPVFRSGEYVIYAVAPS
jgi:YYY domain-containing protein